MDLIRSGWLLSEVEFEPGSGFGFGFVYQVAVAVVLGFEFGSDP